MIKYLCIKQYVSLYINILLFHFKDVVLNLIFCPSIKFPSSTYTNKLACRKVSSKVNKCVGSQVYSKVLIFSNIKLLFIILVSKHRSYFSSKNLLLYIQYQSFCRRIHNVAYSPYVPGLANVIKVCLIMKIIFLPVTSRYTNTSLP